MTIARNLATVERERERERESYTLVNKSAGLLSDELNRNKIKDSNVSLF